MHLRLLPFAITFAAMPAMAIAPPASPEALEAMAETAIRASSRVAAATRPADVKQAEAAADAAWGNLLREANRALSLRGRAASGYDRSRLYELCGEAHLHTHQFTPAAESFSSAAKEPGVTEARADLCRSMARLMPRTDARGYQPPAVRGKETSVIELQTEAGRRRATAACLDDALEDVEQILKKANGLRVIKIAADCVARNEGLRPLERFARNSTAACDAQRDRIIEKVNETLAAFTQESREILAAAELGVTAATSQPAGAASQPAKSAEAIAADCRQIANDYEKLAGALGDAVPSSLARHTRDIQNIYDTARRLRGTRTATEVLP